MNLAEDKDKDFIPAKSPWRGQWLGYICITMLIVFTWLPHSYFLMVSYPWIIIWQLGFLALGIWMIWMLRQFKIPFKLLGYGLDWAVGAMVTALILSGIFARFKVVSTWSISQALCYVVLLYVLRNWLITKKFTIQDLWQKVSLVGVISCLTGLAVWYPLMLRGDEVRIGFPLGHPNFVAGYILLILPLTLTLALANKGWQRIGAFAASSLMLLVLYLTGSRGGFVGLLALAIATIVVYVATSKGKKRWLRLLSCIISLAILLTVAVNNSRVQRIVKINGLGSDAPLVQLKIDGQTKDRLLMLEAAGNILQDRPLFGVGAGNMSRVFNLYRPIETGTGSENVQQLHNTPVQILGELGLVGFSAYVFLLFNLFRLGFRIYYRTSRNNHRYLLCGIGGSFLGYSAMTLTDYQLENISLSTHLVIFMVILIALADREKLNKVKSISNYGRRITSLVTIIFIVSTSLLWIPQALALRLAKNAQKDFVAIKLDSGYEKISQAANLVKWDPTYNAIAAIRTLQIRQPIQEKKLYQELTDISLNHLQKAVKASPTDPHFTQMLGMAYRDRGDSDQAIKYFRRAVQILPRSSAFTYYLLGAEYLKTDQKEQAITALTLQSLIDPEFLISTLWRQPVFAPIKTDVYQKTMFVLDRLLEKLKLEPANYKGINNYNDVYEKKIILEWWNGDLDLENVEQARLRPIIRALLVAEKNPQFALEILDSNGEVIRNKLKNKLNTHLLLKAWLDPDKYLAEYLNSDAMAELSSSEKESVESLTRNNRVLKNWLQSIQLKFASGNRTATRLIYRNEEISKAAILIFPTELSDYMLTKKINLFEDYFREVPALENLINEIQIEELNLRNPTINNFKLESLTDVNNNR